MHIRWTFLLSLAACGLEPDGPGSSARGIVGGLLDPGDPEAFMIAFTVYGIPNMCSATLIGERTLLTAAHCVSSSFYPGSPTLQFRASNAADARSAPASTFIDVVDQRIHPDWGLLAARPDLALLLLATSPGVPPKPINRGDLSGFIGAPVRTIGYGLTDPDDIWSFGQRHQVDITIRAVDANYLTVGDGLSRGFCSGDSGGPTFATFPDGVERLIGVHSIGETCVEGQDVRVDAYVDFIQDWLDEKELGISADAGALAAPDAAIALDGAGVEAGAPPGPTLLDAGAADAAFGDDAALETGEPPTGQPAAVDKPSERLRVLRDDASCDCTSTETHVAWPSFGIVILFLRGGLGILLRARRRRRSSRSSAADAPTGVELS